MAVVIPTISCCGMLHGNSVFEESGSQTYFFAKVCGLSTKHVSVCQRGQTTDS